MKKLWISLFAFLFSIGTAWAGPTCYTQPQMDAENLLRLHSELMVATVTCKVGSGGEDLVAPYADFTKKNITMLHGAEQVMMSYYKGRGLNGQDNLDLMRTKLGNEFGQKITKTSAQDFCDHFRDKVLTFDKASEAEIHTEVTRMEDEYKPFAKLCGAPKAKTAKSAKSKK